MSRSDGAIALARTSKTHEEITKLVGVSRVGVSHWVAGSRRPTPEKRKKLFELFGIPVDAWERRDRTRASAFERAVAAAVTPDATAAVTEPVTSVTSGTTAVTKLSVPHGVIAKAVEFERMAHELMNKLHDDAVATPLEQAKVMASVASTLTHLAKLTGQYDLGRRLFRLPVWARIRRALADGLRGHPEAAKSVEEELRRVEAETDAAA